MSEERDVTSMGDIAAAWTRTSAIIYLAFPSMYSLAGEHAAHIEQCRGRAIHGGLEAEEAGRILEDVKGDAYRSGGDMAWIDAEYARRLGQALLALMGDTEEPT